MAEIYCFNLPEAVRGHVAALSMRYRIRMVEAGPEKAGLTVKELAAGFPGKDDSDAFEESLLLMDHFDQQQFNGFLDDLKQCTPRFSGFKAIVTPSNRKWKVSALVEELRQEKMSIEQERAKAREAAQQ
ncbi:MAG: DUF3783 domain-containing protein [Clostridia bacterium]|nr:DUF3783 domain-containing protein [Clostridia bacterium]